MRGSEIREPEGRNTLITNCCSVVLLYIFTINMYEETYTLYTARHQTEEAGEWNRKGLWKEGIKAHRKNINNNNKGRRNAGEYDLIRGVTRITRTRTSTAGEEEENLHHECQL